MTESPNSYTHRTSKDFTMIQNGLIRSPSLSCKAFKLLCIGLSHSGKWIFRKSQICTCFKEGDYTVDEAMKELRSLGYLHLTAKTSEGNKFNGHRWFWFEHPVSEEDFKIFLRDLGFQGFGDSRDSENPGDLRKQIPKKTNLDKKNNNQPTAESPAAVVVSSLLDKIEISESLKRKITKTYTEPQIAQALACLENMYPDNLEATLQAALRDGWEPKLPAEDIEAKNKVYLDSLRCHEGRKLGHYTIDVSPTVILFRHSCIDGSKDVFYKIDQKGFIAAVKAFFTKHGKLD